MLAREIEKRDPTAADNEKEYTVEAAAYKERVQRALTLDYSPERLLKALKSDPKLEHFYVQDSAVLEDYSIETHTLFVLHQFERYFTQSHLPGFSLAAMRVTLALHDIGKPLVDAHHSQRDRTVEILEAQREKLPLSDGEFRIAKALIDHDALGKLLWSHRKSWATVEQRKAMHTLVKEGVCDSVTLRSFAALTKLRSTVELMKDPLFHAKIAETASWFTWKAAELGMTGEDFLTLAIVYYQADTSAYTSDAILPTGERAKSGLEYLYCIGWHDGHARPDKLFCHEEDRIGQHRRDCVAPLLFSSEPRYIMAALEEHIAGIEGRHLFGASPCSKGQDTRSPGTSSPK